MRNNLCLCVCCGHHPASRQTLMRTLRLSTTARFIGKLCNSAALSGCSPPGCLRCSRVEHSSWSTKHNCLSIYTTFRPLFPICHVSTFVRLLPSFWERTHKRRRRGRGKSLGRNWKRTNPWNGEGMFQPMKSDGQGLTRRSSHLTGSNGSTRLPVQAKAPPSQKSLSQIDGSDSATGKIARTCPAPRLESDAIPPPLGTPFSHRWLPNWVWPCLIFHCFDTYGLHVGGVSVCVTLFIIEVENIRLSPWFRLHNATEADAGW